MDVGECFWIDCGLMSANVFGSNCELMTANVFGWNCGLMITVYFVFSVYFCES